ncbi:MAG: 50S ribosomal protein L15 [Gammaproteobacteria bacterium]|nr:50S ribosomal protein L15 [Gammaproteobacteria bacterium]HRX71897.1 50S ribosomal protein L15 [Candidatus Competibacteraceae bacterium]
MRLNTLKPAPGSRPDRVRVGRGIGSGLGKTAGRGHKGQHARAGGYHKVGFEGGQMPLQRRLPKRGFRSMTAKDTAEVRVYALAKVQAEVIDLPALQAAHLVPIFASKVKVILSGKLEKSVTVRGLTLTKGAKEAILAAGGVILE